MRKVNEDLRRERTTCTFNLEELTHFINDGAKNTERRKNLGILYNTINSLQ